MSRDTHDAEPFAQDEAILDQARQQADAEAQRGNSLRARELLAEAAARLTSRELAAVVSAELLPKYAGAGVRLAPLANTATVLRRRLRRRAAGE